MLLGTFAAKVIGNMLVGKGDVRPGEGAPATNKGQRSVRAGQQF